MLEKAPSIDHLDRCETVHEIIIVLETYLNKSLRFLTINELKSDLNLAFGKIDKFCASNDGPINQDETNYLKKFAFNINDKMTLRSFLMQVESFRRDKNARSKILEDYKEDVKERYFF